MNITEGNAANVVLRYLLGIEPLPDDEKAQEAAVLLAERANRALHAGLRAEQVAQAWPNVIVCPGATS